RGPPGRPSRLPTDRPPWPANPDSGKRSNARTSKGSRPSSPSTAATPTRSAASCPPSPHGAGSAGPRPPRTGGPTTPTRPPSPPPNPPGPTGTWPTVPPEGPVGAPWPTRLLAPPHEQGLPPEQSVFPAPDEAAAPLPRPGAPVDGVLSLLALDEQPHPRHPSV